LLAWTSRRVTGGEKYEIRYEDENIWMSQKMLAAVYGVEVPNIAYHLRKLFADAELDKGSVIKEILITAEDGKKYRVNHYNLQVIIALGFKIDNERAVQIRKWANRIVGDYTIRGYVMDKERFKKGAPSDLCKDMENFLHSSITHILSYMYFRYVHPRKLTS
jgi:hypothetical protein